MSRTERKPTQTSGRSATTRTIMGEYALAVGMPTSPAPEGWTWAKLTDLARLESGHTPSKAKPEYWRGNIPWIGLKDAREHHGKEIHETLQHTNDLGLANSAARLLPAKTVCLSRTASVGYVIVMGREMATSQDFVNWVCSDQINHDYLKYLLIAEKPSYRKFSSGAVHQTIYFPEVKAFHVCLPRPAEQKRIVAILDEALPLIAKARRNAEKNLEYSRQLFKRSVHQYLTPSDDWNLCTIGDVCSAVEYGTSSKSSAEGAIPVLRMGNIQDGCIDWTDLAFTDDEDEITKYMLEKSDVLFNRTNSAEHVGKTCIYRGERPAIFAGYLIRLHYDRQRVDGEYLNFFLNSDSCRAYGKTVMSESINQANINGTKLKSYPFAFPSWKQQKEIAARLNEIRRETENLQKVYSKKLATLEELTQALLKNAFTGRLTAKAAEKIVANV